MCEGPLYDSDGMLTPAADELWQEAERNTIQEIVCRVHPDGADAIPEFWKWYEGEKSNWFGAHRACGAWLYRQLKKDKE